MAARSNHSTLYSPPQEGLYCLEDSFEQEGESSASQCNDGNRTVAVLEHDIFWGDEDLWALFAKEEANPMETHPSLAGPRLEAVEWILRVHSYYNFSCLTAVLAVNYLDRFLSSFHLQAGNYNINNNNKPWMTQLVAVACLSLAAKFEETYVPLLLDLQVEDTKYVFEAKTIQRMEILVLSTLGWRMNPVTPLSFVDYFTRRLDLKNYLCWEFLRRCELLLLSVISDFGCTQYSPSVIATATMFQVINGGETSLGSEFRSQLLGILQIDKIKVEECREIVRELASRDHRNHLNKRKFGSISDIPGSPNGIMDITFSSGSICHDPDPRSTGSASSSVSSSPEPLSKKGKAVEELEDDRSPADLSSIQNRSLPSFAA